MRDEIAEVVYPVLRYGVRLRQRLAAGQADKLDWQVEQKQLLSLLQATPKSREAIADYLGDHQQNDVLRSQSGGARYETFLGIRYALACWIDEIMIQSDLPWNDLWNNSKIEDHLYGANLRAEKFWDQARRAQVRPSRDPLEVFYLCVVLGFRGELAKHPEKVLAWKDQVEGQVAEDHPFTPPPDQNVQPNVPTLTGAQRKQGMVLAVTVTVWVLILLGLFGVFILPVFIKT